MWKQCGLIAAIWKHCEVVVLICKQCELQYSACIECHLFGKWVGFLDAMWCDTLSCCTSHNNKVPVNHYPINCIAHLPKQDYVVILTTLGFVFGKNSSDTYAMYTYKNIISQALCQFPLFILTEPKLFLGLFKSSLGHVRPSHFTKVCNNTSV